MAFSRSTDASHMAFAVDRTKNIRWSCSNTLSWTLVLTRPCRTVALSRSSHLCRDNSLSSTGTPWTTSNGPHSMNSRTDFAWFRETARSSCSMSFRRGVSFSPGRRISLAFIAHLHRELRWPSSVDLQFISSLNLEIERNIVKISFYLKWVFTGSFKTTRI